MVILADPSTFGFTINAPGGGGGDPEPSEQTVTADGLSATFDNALASGYYADGMPWVQYATGLQLTSKDPAVDTTTIGGRTMNGFMVNPELSSHAYDSQSGGWTGGWSSGLLPTMPLDLEVGDCVMFTRSAQTTGGSGSQAWRDGVVANQMWVHIVSAPPAAGAFSPPAVWDSRKKRERPVKVPDIAGLLSRLPSYSSGAHTGKKTWAQVKAYIGRPNATIMQPVQIESHATGWGSLGTTTGGYEFFCVRGFSDSNGSNYGRYLARTISAACTGLCSDHWSTQDKTECLTWLLQHGCQWGERFIEIGRWTNGDGGHVSWHYAPILLWLDAIGELGRYHSMFALCGRGNVLEQYFKATASQIANDFIPHDSNSQPYPWRRRTVLAIAGTVLDLSYFFGTSSGDPSHGTFTGLRLTRESDGKQAIITGNSNFGTPTAGRVKVTINAQPSPAFQVNDVVYCEPYTPIEEGDPHWTMRDERFSAFSPNYNVGYRDLNHHGPQHFIATALGLHHEFAEAAREYQELVNAGGYPDATYPYPDGFDEAFDTWSKQMWDDHYATAKLVSSRFIGVSFGPTNCDFFIDPSDLSTMKQERTGTLSTTAVAVGDPVGSLRNKGSRGGWFVAGADDQRPVLRQTVGGKYYLEFNSAHALVFTGNIHMRDGFHLFMAAEEVSGAAASTPWWALSSNGQSSSNTYGYRLHNGSTSQLISLGMPTGSVAQIGSGLRSLCVMEGKMQEGRTTELLVDGASVSTSLAPTVWSGYYRMVLGAHWNSSAPGNFCKGNIFGFALYLGKDMDSTQASAVRSAMAALAGL